MSLRANQAPHGAADCFAAHLPDLLGKSRAVPGTNATRNDNEQERAYDH
ncbi:MAG TPA: hypothetical protein VK206_01625 [Anaerolineales bacterium]|nr:hypothetical protein [Anaerolineales bacterium]